MPINLYYRLKSYTLVIGQSNIKIEYFNSAIRRHPSTNKQCPSLRT